MSRPLSRNGYSSDYYPKTPKMSSVALPLSSPLKGRPQALMAPPVTSSRPLMSATSSTSSSGRRHTIPQDSQPPTRQRSSSNASVGSKPLKGILKKPSPPVENTTSKSTTKPILKTQRSSSTKGSDHYYTDSEQLVKSSEHHARRTSLNGHARKGSTDSTSSQNKDTPVNDLKKDKPANLTYNYSDRDARIPLVEKSRLKSEVISLNWLLRCQDSIPTRKRAPDTAHLRRFFDIAFSPDPHPHSNGRGGGAQLWDISRRTYLSPSSTRTYFEAPASPHCTLTKMYLIISANPEWSIVLERSREKGGIRCIDVFRAIHDLLQVPLTKDELAMIPPGSIRYCEDARDARVADRSKKGGNGSILRIDSFVNYRFFKGLTQKDGTWMLDTCSPEGTPFPTPPQSSDM